MRVAVLGTGMMGAGLARSMRRAGLDVAAWNRTRSRAEPLAEDGIAIADTVEDAVSGADAALTMLFDADAVLAVAPALTGALRSDAVWLQSSTVGRQGMDRIRAAAADAGLLDAPLVGTKEPAEQGKLVALVSGPAAAREKVRPVLDAVATKTVDVGAELGAASALKLAVNAWTASITAAAAQSLALSQKLGVDPELFLKTVDGGPTNAPFLQLKGNAMLSEDWSPSFAVDGVIKDLDLMRSAGAATGFRTDLLDTVRALFAAASEAGHGSEDMAAVRTAFG